MKVDQGQAIEEFTAMVESESALTSERRTLSAATLVDLRNPDVAEWFDLLSTDMPAMVALERVTEISKACTATGWTISVFAGARKIFEYLPAGVREDILVQCGGVPLLAAGLMPAGTVRLVGGEAFLSGRWPYVSGAEYADYILLAASVPSAGATEVRFFPVPQQDVLVEDTWTTVGLGGTRTNAVTVTDLPVSVEASCSRIEWLTGVSGDRQGVPGAALSGLTFLAPALGAAYAAFDSLVLSVRRTPLSEYEVVRLSGLLHSVQLLLQDNATLIDSRVGGKESRARIDRNSAYAAEVLHEASARMKALGGTSGMMQSPLGRAVGDLDTAISHVALKYETAACRTFPDTVFAPS